MRSSIILYKDQQVQKSKVVGILILSTNLKELEPAMALLGCSVFHHRHHHLPVGTFSDAMVEVGCSHL